MKEAIVHPTPDLWTETHDVPIPSPGVEEIVIKVVVAGSNVKDWLHPTLLNVSLNSGDDIAGIVCSLGSNVSKTNEFRIGDRVAAFHPMMTPHGAFAEYAVAPQHTVFKIPITTSFEEAATVPLVVTTAGITLFRRQHLPSPWSPSSGAPIPLIIYGASGALGTFAIKLARASNIHPIIAIAGGNSSHLPKLLDESKGDTMVDYRLGSDEMKRIVKETLSRKGLECHHALDAISSDGTWIPVSQMLTPSTPKKHSYLSVVSGSNKYEDKEIPPGVEVVYTYVGTAHSGTYRDGMTKQPDDKEFVRSDPEWTYVFFSSGWRNRRDCTGIREA
ncbi:related to zeta-crystallin / quinone reductase (NADPH) [Phialocephala subalpina]|uniref:Related to zeta-crystallin / quinone reductase (NADPH) n=1 Tax=Phialocephala subalpina TaxID=576137 RepID=A0A1L7XGL3_9HELO|nr:related to zeta-crystallin / quinone reductase (NADPH) [Phialocephala subalpina]